MELNISPILDNATPGIQPANVTTSGSQSPHAKTAYNGATTKPTGMSTNPATIPTNPAAR